MSTHCQTVQFLEPDPQTLLSPATDDVSGQVQESGSLHLVIDQGVYTVLFDTPKLGPDYELVSAALVNTIDADPMEVGWSIVSQDKNGFIVSFTAAPTTSNYLWNWMVRLTTLPT